MKTGSSNASNGRQQASMTLRERWNRLLKGESVDRLPFVEFLDLFWVHHHRWSRQGLPENANPFVHFGLDEADNDRATDWLNRGRGKEVIEPDLFALPRFEPKPVRAEGEYFYTFDVRTGSSLKRLRARAEGNLGAKTGDDPPVKTHEDWNEHKKRFDPHAPDRYPRVRQYTHHLNIYPLEYPQTWEQVAVGSRRAGHLVTAPLSTGYAHFTNTVGFERSMEMLALEPEWAAEMAEYFGWFFCETMTRAVETARLDFIELDDYAPPRTVHGELLIGPDMFLKFFGKAYEKSFELAARNSVRYVWVPLTRNEGFDRWVFDQAARRGLTPLVPADSIGPFDVAAQRNRYGCSTPMLGGMDVEQLLAGPDAIDAMLDAAFEQAEKGLFIPLLNDRYGKLLEVPLENYACYARSFRKRNGMKGEYTQNEKSLG